jgi:predicted TPR repeat methyltransferase
MSIDQEQEQELTLSEAIALAVRLQQTGQIAQAEELYRRILQIAPEQPDVLHFLGILRYQQGQGEEAVRLIRRAVEQVPEHADAHNNLGNVLKQLGRSEEAQAAYQRVIELQPEHADAHNNLGILLRKQNRLEEAVAAYRRAVSSNPQHADAYYNLGNALGQLDRHREAVDAYRRAVELNPNHLEAYKQLGTTLYRVGRSDEAIAVYKEWLRLSPNHPVALHMLAACSGDDVPTRATDDYVQQLFDGFANEFDEHLGRLNYRAPELVMAAIANTHGSPEQNLTILDAGCGTGLCGPLLRPYSKHLSGVDLSPGMLEKARGRDCYDELVCAELTAFLNKPPAIYDVIACVDTLCYFGDLRAVLQHAADALRSGGRLIFTVEALADDEAGDFQLEYSGRYSHSKEYLHRVLDAAGFTIDSMQPAHLRLEGGHPVEGRVVAVLKITHSAL